jgi:hypothetical protein
MSMRGPALVIIDMQRFFYERGQSRPSRKETFVREWHTIVGKIVVQVALAKFQQIPIVVVEFRGFSPSDCKTDKRITRAIGDYPLRRVAIKMKDDGSEAIKDALRKLEWEPTGFLITGVNRAYCVTATMVGLAWTFPNATINALDDAIGDEYGNYRYGWSSQPPNAHIIMERGEATSPLPFPT